MPAGFRVAACLALAVTSASAPYQCSRNVPHDERNVETTEEVLYNLAEKFRIDGDRSAQVKTLRHLVARFPSSRFAKMAQEDLEKLGEKP